MRAVIEKAGSHANDYRSRIRSAIRGLWTGVIDRSQFLDIMGLTIDRSLRFAWAEGAKDCGITPADYSPQEEQALRDAQAREEMYVPQLADAVEEGSKANKGKLTPLFQRSEAWILRYKDVVNRGRTMACGDKKYRWDLGPTEHCSTCAKLAGQVRRGSFWRTHVMPQMPPNEKLECQGWRWGCNLALTDEPVSRGRLPNLP